ncbi:hypothetical protein FG05_35049 [Fusarium graminearum]|nr:hypothetical protein FG05_35049 [Fusarium graminearum]
MYRRTTIKECKFNWIAAKRATHNSTKYKWLKLLDMPNIMMKLNRGSGSIISGYQSQHVEVGQEELDEYSQLEVDING